MKLPRETTRSGFSLIEMAVTSAFFSVLMAALSAAIISLGRAEDTAEVSLVLQDEAARALTQIRADLTSSGVVAANGTNYPYIFLDGDADAPFDIHDHAPAAKTAGPNDDDFGPNQEIVFALPADDDGDGIPDLDVAGDLEWDVRNFTYTVVTRADGDTVLERRINAVGPVPVARHVERVAFDDAFSAVGEVPLDCVRVRLWFRLRDSSGLTNKYFIESMIRLRNGG